VSQDCNSSTVMEAGAYFSRLLPEVIAQGTVEGNLGKAMLLGAATSKRLLGQSGSPE